MLNCFERDGYVFDTGARSIGNSGIIKPMLKDIGIDLPLVQSPVSVNASEKHITDTHGKRYHYDHLIWAADLKNTVCKHRHSKSHGHLVYTPSAEGLKETHTVELNAIL